MWYSLMSNKRFIVYALAMHLTIYGRSTIVPRILLIVLPEGKMGYFDVGGPVKSYYVCYNKFINSS